MRTYCKRSHSTVALICRWYFILCSIATSSAFTIKSSLQLSTTLLFDANFETSELQQALQIAEERTVEQFAENEAPEWMANIVTFPFECTSCGKCCKTQGDVYLSSREVEDAADLLDLSVQEFTDEYADEVLTAEVTGDIASLASATWTRLKDVKEQGTGIKQCIFLDSETNHCQIYEVRPTQCSTYPFWPNIMASMEAWNAECRAEDDADSSDELPVWNATIGGCEGMSVISDDNGSDDGGVSRRDAYKNLYLSQ